jgi:hypothetical protein
MTDCAHRTEPYPDVIVQRIDDNPLPQGPPPRIVPCLDCGAPIDRGRYEGMTSVPDLYDEHTWPYGRDDD